MNRAVHLALVQGDLNRRTRPLVRVHMQDTLGDVVGVRRPVAGLAAALSAIKRIAEEGQGVVVMLRGHETPRDLMDAVDGSARPPTIAVTAARGMPCCGPTASARRSCAISA